MEPPSSAPERRAVGATGCWAAPSSAGREPGARLERRTRRRGTVVLVAANAVGAVLTLVLSTWVVPAPYESAANIRLNAIVFGAYTLVALAAGSVLIRRLARHGSRWLREERAPTASERERAIRWPLEQTAIEAVAWVGAAILFTALNIAYSGTLAAEVGVEIVLGGLATCALTYLLGERFARPAVARALSAAPPRSASGPGVEARLSLTWVFGSAIAFVALALLGVVALTDLPASRHRIGLAVVLLAALGILVGFFTTRISGRSLTEPLRSLRAALARVERGELDVAVPVDDAGEVGLVQAGFNQMAAGLAERERMRDLFGRHVGHEVVREALGSEQIELGGEVLDAAILFVDVVGSTTLAATEEPATVVAHLNSFFAIVVDCVSLHGGWVNKFEGDGALCVFGAPSAHPDPAGSALATARALRQRLDRELDGIVAAIGVSAGRVVAGNVGAAERFEYTVIGDPVNEAARLTELAKGFECHVLASDAALARAGERERARWRVDHSEELRGRRRTTGIALPA